jgi:hypothetical protein
LKDFYANTQQVPYLERGVCLGVEHGLRVTITPVGVARQPASEAELQRAVKCLLTCLQSLHLLCYAHMDIRWPNVILVGADWFLIDSEHAQKFGSPAPKLKLSDPSSEKCAASCDLYLLGKMMSGCEQHLGVGGKAVRDLLISDKRNTLTAANLMKMPWVCRVHL